MTCKETLEAYLREKGVPYQSQHHARAITAQEVAATEHVPGRMFAKTVMVLPDDEVNMVMLVLPAPYHVNPLNRRLSCARFISPTRNASLTPSPTARWVRCRPSGTSTR